MFSNKKLKELKAAVSVNTLTTGLTDEQVLWVKNKLVDVENLTTLATTKFVDLTARIVGLEIKATQIQARLTAIEIRLTKHGI